MKLACLCGKWVDICAEGGPKVGAAHTGWLERRVEETGGGDGWRRQVGVDGGGGCGEIVATKATASHKPPVLSLTYLTHLLLSYFQPAAHLIHLLLPTRLVLHHHRDDVVHDCVYRSLRKLTKVELR